MPRSCQVCAHPDSLDINTALVVDKSSNRSIAKQYGVDHNAVQRHRQHIPPLLVQASQAEEIASADLILDKLVDLENEARVALKATKDAGEWRTFLAAIGEIRENVKLLAQVSGKLREIQVNNTQVNVAIDARTQQVIVDSLEPYPEARVAVAQALKELEAPNVRE